MQSEQHNPQSKAFPYLLVTAGYALIWTLVFSRLQYDVYLILALLVALAYASGQAYAMLKRDKVALSADPIALPWSLVVTVIAVVIMVQGGWLHAGLRTYLDIGIRYSTAFFLGHVAALGVALMGDKFMS